MHKLLLSLPLIAAAAAASATPLPNYPTPGAVNPAVYSFTAVANGPVIAYFAGHEAGFTNLLGLLVNGIDTGILGLNNQTTPIGTSLNFGNVNAGDTLVFYIKVTNTGDVFYSDPALNPGKLNHVFSAPYVGGLTGPGGTIPAGTYVGFEDIRGGGDLDYDDMKFVFTNVAAVVIPEPATWAMLIAGFGLVGFAARRSRAAARLTA